MFKIILVFLILSISIISCSIEEVPRLDESGTSLEVKPEMEIDVSSPTFGVVQILRVSGAKIEVVGETKQDFFKTKGYVLKINGESFVDVFEYESSENLDAAANGISKDGMTINSIQAKWGSTPHFYKTNRVIIEYIGDDKQILKLLENVSPQFAGWI